MNNTHYSLAFKPAELSRWAVKEAKRLANLFVNTKGLPVLVYTGLSGVSTATALAIELDKYQVKYGMAYIRKGRESSHGCDMEHTYNLWNCHDYYMVFVDDFVDMGDTTRRCYKKLANTYGKPTGIVFSLCMATNRDDSAIKTLKKKYGEIK